MEAKKAVPREEQHGIDRSGVNGGGSSPMLSTLTRTKKIFVGGLSSTVTETDFRNYFEQFGLITDVVVMYDHGTQRPRGFGFITYESEDAVDRVLLKTFHELKEKRVEVKRAVPKDMTSGPNRSSGVVGLGLGLTKSSSYGGSCVPAFNSSSISPYNMRLETRYNPCPSRSNYSAYGSIGYENYIPSTNVSAGFYSDGAYRSSPNPNGSSVYGSIGSNSISINTFGSYPGRSVWSTEGGSYGNFTNPTGLGGSGGSTNPTNPTTMSNYGGSETWAASPQLSNDHNIAYSNHTYGHRDSYASFVNMSKLSYVGRNGGSGSLLEENRSRGGNNGLFADIHSSGSGYNSSAWQPSGDAFNSSSMAFSGIYGINSLMKNNGDDSPAVDDGYGVQGRPSYRGMISEHIFCLKKETS